MKKRKNQVRVGEMEPSSSVSEPPDARVSTGTSQTRVKAPRKQREPAERRYGGLDSHYQVYVGELLQHRHWQWSASGRKWR